MWYLKHFVHDSKTYRAHILAETSPHAHGFGRARLGRFHHRSLYRNASERTVTRGAKHIDDWRAPGHLKSNGTNRLYDDEHGGNDDERHGHEQHGYVGSANHRTGPRRDLCGKV